MPMNTVVAAGVVVIGSSNFLLTFDENQGINSNKLRLPCHEHDAEIGRRYDL